MVRSGGEAGESVGLCRPSGPEDVRAFATGASRHRLGLYRPSGPREIRNTVPEVRHNLSRCRETPVVGTTTQKSTGGAAQVLGLQCGRILNKPP